jgi:hypothetical protein
MQVGKPRHGLVKGCAYLLKLIVNICGQLSQLLQFQCTASVNIQQTCALPYGVLLFRFNNSEMFGVGGLGAFVSS